LCQHDYEYRNINGLRRHEAQKHKEYNVPPMNILSLEIPEFLVRQFKQEIISSFWGCYKNNRGGRGWKKFILTCHEAIFVKIFRNYITRYSDVDRWYRCVFKGEEGKINLNECLGSENWAIKYFENNEVVFSDICTWSEGGDVIFMWKEIKIIDNRGNETISNKLTVKLCINRSTLNLSEINNNL